MRKEGGALVSTAMGGGEDDLSDSPAQSNTHPRPKIQKIPYGFKGNLSLASGTLIAILPTTLTPATLPLESRHMSQENDPVQAFIEHWSKAEASEMANSQSFIKDLTAILGVPPPSNSHSDGYSFEFPVKVPGSLVGNRIDLYRRSHFVWESKQFVAPKEELTDLELVAIKAASRPPRKSPARSVAATRGTMPCSAPAARPSATSATSPPMTMTMMIGHVNLGT